MTTRKIWDLNREMTPRQYKVILAELDLSRAAASRVLGVSQRTSSRYWYGKTPIPPAHAMLLRAFSDANMLPAVPKWSKND